MMKTFSLAKSFGFCGAFRSRFKSIVSVLLAVEDSRQEINVGLLGHFIWSIFPTLPAFRQVFSTGNWSCYTPPHSTDQNTVLLHKTQELSVYRCLSWLVCFTAWVQCLMGWFQPSNCPNIHPWAAVQIPDLPGHLLPTCRGGASKCSQASWLR